VRRLRERDLGARARLPAHRAVGRGDGHDDEPRGPRHPARAPAGGARARPRTSSPSSAP
jgi:hypothetical protein